MGNSDLWLLLATSGGCSLVIVSLLLYGAKWGRRLLRALGVRVHEWSYRNPANRTCKHCDLCQHQYERNYYGLFHHRNPTWWEDQYTPPTPDKRCLW